MRQFGIRLEQRELIGVLNTIPLNSLRFVVEETICSKCSDKVHQEIVDRPMSGVYEISFVLEQMVGCPEPSVRLPQVVQPSASRPYPFSPSSFPLLTQHTLLFYPSHFTLCLYLGK